MSVHANADQLTALANRRGFWTKGSQILIYFESDDHFRILPAFLDLDGFSVVNDQHGNEAGKHQILAFIYPCFAVVFQKNPT